MRSIRLSLIVYFLVLLALALGGVSWLVYRNTGKTLREKQASTARLIDTQFQSQAQEERAALDRHILRQAQTVASLARFSNPNNEPYNALGLLTMPMLPQGHLTSQLWLMETYNWPLASQLYRMRLPDIVIESPDDLLPDPEDHQPHEYFQTYRRLGKPLHGERMDDFQFTLDAKVRDELKLPREKAEEPDPKPGLKRSKPDEPKDHHFDDVTPKPGLNLRRVTLKTIVFRHRPSAVPPAWRFLYFAPKKAAKGRPPTPDKSPPMPQMGFVEKFAPVIYVQYASDTRLMDAKIEEFRGQRDAKLAQLDTETRDELRALRWQLVWICLATFGACVVGGWLLVRTGLAPLARLSDAVSNVSERDFRLKIDRGLLPGELQTIAGRLASTLEQLQRAFDREKQAAADISHELRTPLAAMMTTLEVALRKTRTPAEYRELIEECRASGEHMSHLVERLLALARLDAGAEHLKTEPVDAATVARQCANLIKPLAEARGLALRVHAPDPVPLEADPDKLREVLNNLLHNAIEYNKPQGSIDLNVARSNGHVQLEVRDTGVGISPEARDRIFERFFRADPSRHADTPHAGLGLAIVKSYVDLMGGTIGVESDGQGSTFRVELPAS